MSTITKEWLQQAINDYESVRDELPFGLDEYQGNILSALRISLASLEAEAVADVVAWSSPNEERTCDIRLRRHDIKAGPLYTAQPAPANAEPVAWLWSHRKHPSEVSLVRPEDDEKAESALWSGWSCQALYAEATAAMLQSFGNSEQLNSPVIPSGWVMVPVEPTIAILDEFDSIIDYGAEDSKDAWSRLLAAAWIKSLPAAPQLEVK
ncbi:hypothetical protein [Enterobacter hormaechei]|uniref:hypothetical protein n=1 Tax=Enterobacter hormaechei TaxID=158836 RepID=UPI0022F00051|nr:hypothetical protein [Enterobacter hormaechei]MDA4840596.1 hypothetical protein [Enterobacter hormaechei]